MRKNFSVFIKNKINKFNRSISKIPGCKSTSFRALIFSSQAIGISHLKGVLESDDIKCCIKSLKDLGVRIIKIKSGEYKIYGNGENSYIQPKNKYLYFVARGDGSSEFSRTLSEHNKAVWKYQKIRKNRKAMQRKRKKVSSAKL